MSFLARFFCSAEKADSMTENSLLGSSVARIGLSERITRPLKNTFSIADGNSRIFGLLRALISTLLHTTARFSGIFLVTFGIYAAAVFLLKFFMHIDIGVTDNDDLIIAGLMLICGIPLLFSKKSHLRLMQESRVCSWLLCDMLGMNEMLLREKRIPRTHGSLAFALGTICGAATLALRPATVLIFAVCLIVVAMVMSAPEVGLLLSLMLVFPAPVGVVTAVFTLTVVSYLYKLARSKRNIAFNTPGILVLIFLLFSLFSGLVSNGAMPWVTIIAVAVYFAAANLVPSTELLRKSLYCLRFGGFLTLFLYLTAFIAGFFDFPAVNLLMAVINPFLPQAQTLGFVLVLTVPLIVQGFSEKGQRVFSLVSALLVIFAVWRLASYPVLIGVIISALLSYAFAFKSLAVPLMFGGAFTLLFKTILRDALTPLSRLPHIPEILYKTAARYFFCGIGSGSEALPLVLYGTGEAISSGTLYLTMILNGGIFYLISFILALLFILQSGFSRISQNENRELCRITGTLCAVIIVFTVAGLFYDPTADMRIYMLFWAVCGLTAGKIND